MRAVKLHKRINIGTMAVHNLITFSRKSFDELEGLDLGFWCRRLDCVSETEPLNKGVGTL
jgi:hypothetical protein